MKQMVKLVGGKSELIKAVLPQSHVFEGGEHFRIRFDPVGTRKRQ